MATKTSAHVSFLVWLLVLYIYCSLQGAQASPTTEILASKAIGRQDIIGKYSEKNVTSSVEDNFVELPEEKLVARSFVHRLCIGFVQLTECCHTLTILLAGY
jgi:hypothetical protein